MRILPSDMCNWVPTWNILIENHESQHYLEYRRVWRSVTECLPGLKTQPATEGGRKEGRSEGKEGGLISIKYISEQRTRSADCLYPLLHLNNKNDYFHFLKQFLAYEVRGLSYSNTCLVLAAPLPYLPWPPSLLHSCSISLFTSYHTVLLTSEALSP